MEELIDRNGREKKSHGTPDFPCEVCEPTGSDGFPWHWHEEWELFWVQQGPVAVAAASQRHVLQTGDAVLIGSRVPHAVLPLDGRPYREWDMEFHPRLLYGSQDSVLYRRYVLPFQQSRDSACVVLRHEVPWQKEAALQVYEACRLCLSRAEGYEFETRQALSRIFLAIWRHTRDSLTPPSPGESQQAERVRQMTRYLDRHYDAPVTLAELAARAHLSPRSCQRAFRQYLGLTPMQYLRQQRLQNAARLLAAGALDVTRVCYACGFPDPSAFSRQFRACYGVSPRDFQQKSAAQSASGAGAVPKARRTASFSDK